MIYSCVAPHQALLTWKRHWNMMCFGAEAEVWPRCPCWLKPRCPAWPLTWLSVSRPLLRLAPYPAISSLTLLVLYHFPVTKWLASCCGALMRGREGTWTETTGRLLLHFPHAVQYTDSILQSLLVYLQPRWLQGEIKSNTAVISVGENLIWEDKRADFHHKRKTKRGCNLCILTSLVYLSRYYCCFPASYWT